MGEPKGQCILFSVVFTPSPPSHHGIVWVPSVISLLLTNIVSPVRAWYGIMDGRGFVRPKKKTIVGLLVFNPLCGARYFKGVVVGLWICKYVYTLTRSQIHSYPNSPSIAQLSLAHTKGVGPGTILAWPGWKQPDISVKVDTAQREAGQFKKCCMECVLLYYPSTEFQFTFILGYWKWGSIIWYCENGMPQKDTLDNLRTPVCFRILSTSFTSVSIFSVWCYSSVSFFFYCFIDINRG